MGLWDKTPEHCQYPERQGRTGHKHSCPKAIKLHSPQSPFLFPPELHTLSECQQIPVFLILEMNQQTFILSLLFQQISQCLERNYCLILDLLLCSWVFRNMSLSKTFAQQTREEFTGQLLECSLTLHLSAWQESKLFIHCQEKLCPHQDHILRTKS